MNLRFSATSLFILSLMVASAALAATLAPTERLADQRGPVDLKRLVPEGFGEWKTDTSLVPVGVSADVKAKLEELYTQTLERTYINGKGQRIMLSIAYGGDQRGEATQVHRPEFCYTAQGFRIVRNAVGNLPTEYGALPVRRLVAVQGRRNEPITYWITVGDKATLPGIDRKIAQISYGLAGKIPDGMLVRVSSIDPDEQGAHQLQERFIKDMLGILNPQARAQLAGRFATTS
jgi:EpsI family protein